MKDRLITPNYSFVLAANFLLYFGFYLLMPILPFYLTEVFQAGGSAVGLILSCYTVAALFIRPFSGYLLDTLARKPLYLLSYAVFMAIFGGYMLSGTLMLFIILRIVHGLSFGMVTVAGNTIVIDVMPASRRGEGLGYYGLSNNIAMAVGPMAGLFLHDYYSFNTIFMWALGSCVLGLMVGSCVRTPIKACVGHEPISLDRFLLLKGIPAGLTLLLLSVPYGMTSTYIALYGQQIGIESGIGIFFTLMAVGMAVSRLFSGRQVDKGYINQVILLGIVLAAICYAALYACPWAMAYHPQFGKWLFFGIALLLGVSFGVMFPAFNTMFVNLAPNNQRGTATSTYLISWDVGIGIGIMLGGYMIEVSSIRAAYLLGAVLIVVSLALFRFYAGPYFNKYKLR